MTKGVNVPAAPDGEAPRARGSGARAFLVTMHDPEEGAGVPFVAVQASHSNRSLHFTDLASAFRYLESLDRPGCEERGQDPAGRE